MVILDTPAQMWGLIILSVAPIALGAIIALWNERRDRQPKAEG